MMDDRYARLRHAPLLLPRARSLPLLLSLLLIACATTQNGREAGSAAQPPPAKTTARDIGTALSAAPEKPPEQSKLYRGTGVLIQGQEEGGAGTPQPKPPPPPPGPAGSPHFRSAATRQ